MGCDVRYFCDMCGKTESSSFSLCRISFSQGQYTFDVCDKCNKKIKKFIQEYSEKGRKYHGRYEDDLR